MLTIGKIDNTPAKQMYYENQVAASAEEYYTGAGEAPGSWLSTAASSDLGVRGVISREQLQMLMEGRSPATAEQLAQRTESNKIVALDLTFSAPKSISMLYVLGDAEMKSELTAAHEAAVRGAMAYMEREAGFVRRGKGGVVRFGASFLAAGYRHRTSRELDPQLHTHMVVANMAKGPDGRWTALFGQPIFQHAKAGGAVYQAEFRRRVLELYPQLEWGEVVEGLSELLDVPEPVLHEFSKRRRQIVAGQTKLQMAGVRIGRGGRERINQSTREAKRPIEEGVWEREIRSRASELGFGVDELDQLLQLRPVAQIESVTREVLAQRLFGPDGLTANSNTFHERDVVIAVASVHRAGASLDEIDAEVKALLAHEQVVKVDEGLHPIYTTRGLLELEQRVISQAQAGRAAGTAQIDPAPVASALTAGLPNGVSLYADQSAALHGVVTSGNAIDAVEALAGTGKTTLANAIRVAYEANGYRVIGAGPTGRARRELSERAGITGSTTLDKWALRLGADASTWERVLTYDRDAKRHMPTVMVIDEFGMAATRVSAKVIDAAIRSGVKVIAIGDSGQLPSVAAGGLLRAITRDETLGSWSLTTVRRQYDQREIDLLAQVHDGNPEEYIEWKLAQGDLRVFDGPTPGLDAEAEAVAMLLDARRTFGPTEALLLTSDNERRARINAAVREALRARGELGQQILIGDREWAVGDRVIARRNDDRLDVDNGTRGTVIAVHPRKGLTVRLDSSEPGRPQLRRLNPGYVRAHVQHAFVLTAHGTQGATVQWAAVVGQAGEFFREWAYTSLSRARHRTQILIVAEPARNQLARESIAPADDIDRAPLEELAASMSKSRAQELAVDQLDHAGFNHRPFARAERRTWRPTTEPVPENTVCDLPGRELLAKLRVASREMQDNVTGLQRPDLKHARQIIRLRERVPVYEESGQVLAAQDARDAITTLTDDLHDPAGAIVLAQHLERRQRELGADIRGLVDSAGALLEPSPGVEMRRHGIEIALADYDLDVVAEYLDLQSRIDAHPTEVDRRLAAVVDERRAQERHAHERWAKLASGVENSSELVDAYNRLSTDLSVLTDRSHALLGEIADSDPRRPQIEESEHLWRGAARTRHRADLYREWLSATEQELRTPDIAQAKQLHELRRILLSGPLDRPPADPEIGALRAIHDPIVVGALDSGDAALAYEFEITDIELQINEQHRTAPGLTEPADLVGQQLAQYEEVETRRLSICAQLADAEQRERALLTAAQALDHTIAEDLSPVNDENTAALYDELASIGYRIGKVTTARDRLGPDARKLGEAWAAVASTAGDERVARERITGELDERLTEMTERRELLLLACPDLEQQAAEYTALSQQHNQIASNERDLHAIRSDLHHAVLEASQINSAAAKQLAPERTTVHQQAVEQAPPLFSQSRIDLAATSTKIEELTRQSVDPRYRQARELLEVAERIEHADQRAVDDAVPAGRRDRAAHRERVERRKRDLAVLHARVDELRASIDGAPEELVDQHATLLTEISRLDARAHELLDRAITEDIARHDLWLTETLGPIPADPQLAEAWRQAAERIAAHRIEHGISDPADPGLGHHELTSLLNAPEIGQFRA